MSDIKQKDLVDVLGLYNMSDLEQETVISDIGDIIVESALLRLYLELTEEQKAALDQFKETCSDPETFVRHLLDYHESFSRLLEEERNAFKEDAIAILGK